MQCAQCLGQAHHALCQLGGQKFGNRAGIQQLQRLIGEFTQRCLLNAFSRRVNRRKRLLQFRCAEVALHQPFRLEWLSGCKVRYLF